MITTNHSFNSEPWDSHHQSLSDIAGPLWTSIFDYLAVLIFTVSAAKQSKNECIKGSETLHQNVHHRQHIFPNVW